MTNNTTDANLTIDSITFRYGSGGNGDIYWNELSPRHCWHGNGINQSDVCFIYFFSSQICANLLCLFFYSYLLNFNEYRSKASGRYSECPLLEYTWIFLSLTENTRSQPHNAGWNITQLISVWDKIKRGNHFMIWITTVVKGSETSLLILLHDVHLFSEICFVETIGKIDA